MLADNVNNKKLAKLLRTDVKFSELEAESFRHQSRQEVQRVVGSALNKVAETLNLLLSPLHSWTHRK